MATKLNHAECVERELSDWRKIFSLSKLPYGYKIKKYKGKQKLVFIPDDIDGLKIDWISETFAEDCAVICNERIWKKFGKRGNRYYSAVSFLLHPDAFPEDYSGPVIRFIKNRRNREKIFEIIFRDDDVEAFSAYIDFNRITFSPKEADELLEAVKSAPNIRMFLLNWKLEHFSPEQQEKLMRRQEEIELGIRKRTVAEWKELWDWAKMEDGNIQLRKYKGNEESPSIPEIIGKTKVSGIMGDAFSGVSCITELTVPDCWTKIDNQAFNGCNQLCRVFIHGGIMSIGVKAFEKCEHLTDVIISEGVRSIGISAFSACKNLTNISIPKSVTFIGTRAFSETCHMTIHTVVGSFAEIYARELNIPCKVQSDS